MDIEIKSLQLVNVLFIPTLLQIPLSQARKLPGYHAFFTLEPAYRRFHQFRSRLQIHPEEMIHLKNSVSEIEREITKRTAGFSFMAIAKLMDLIGRLSRFYDRRSDPGGKAIIRLGEVFSYIENHFAQRLRLEDLAQHANMSQSSLQRAFHVVTGRSAIDYLIRLRISHGGTL